MKKTQFFKKNRFFFVFFDFSRLNKQTDSPKKNVFSHFRKGIRGFPV